MNRGYRERPRGGSRVDRRKESFLKKVKIKLRARIIDLLTLHLPIRLDKKLGNFNAKRVSRPDAFTGEGELEKIEKKISITEKCIKYKTEFH